MDVKDLRCFIAVYETGGFSRGARALDTVQSNVSTRIRRLETSLGTALFERRHRRAVPTAKGDVLYECAQRVIALLDESEKMLRDPADAAPRPPLAQPAA